MHQFNDDLGIAYSASSAESVDEFNEAIELYLASKNNVMPVLDKLLENDPLMPMAHCFKAYLIKLSADPRLETMALAELAILDANPLNDRELAHRHALTAWLNNQSSKASQILNDLLRQFPKDMLALRIVHYLNFYAGDNPSLRDSVKTAVSLWQPEERFYGYLLGMYSFGLEEAAEYRAAETYGRRAVELNNQDLWAAHAVAHVMQMTQRFDDGVKWLDDLIPRWQQANNFVYHLHWHQALFHIGTHDHDSALSVYDNHLEAPLADDFYLDICNAASLLWRLEMLQVDVGDRWHKLEQYSINRIKDDELVFSTLHYLMTPARLQRSQITAQALDHFTTWSQADSNQGIVCKQVGLPLAQAIIQLGKQEFSRAAKTIRSIEHNIIQIGGSHAQRHLFTEMLSFARNQA